MGKYNHTVSQVDTLNPQDYWNISHVVTRLFTEAPDASPPTDATLRLLTTRLGWDVGEFWIVNELRMALECAAFYSPTADSFKNFETVSRARRFSFGEGLSRIYVEVTRRSLLPGSKQGREFSPVVRGCP